MSRNVRIYAGVHAGLIFFDGSRVPPAPLGGIVVAVENPTRPGKIRITRSDQFSRDGVTPRRLFKRILPTRIKNKAGQFLVGDLGFTLAQVIDYINDQANKKLGEIDIQNNGALVGGGTTINFKGAIDFINLSNDVANVCIDQVGITTSGGYVGTGVTLFDFRGSGISTITSPSAGVATIFIEGGDVDSIDGSKITGTIDSTQLSPHITGLGGVNFTLGDSDTTPAFDLSDAHSYPYNQLVGIPSTHQTTINEFQWYQQYDNPGTGSSVTGPGITSTDPPEQKNPYYYGTQLKPYQEMTWIHSMSGTGAYWVGKWGGNTTYDPTTAGNVANWERVLAFRNSNADGHHIDYAGGSLDSQGFAFVGGGTGQYTTINSNVSFMRLRYNGDNNKLEIYRGSNTPIGIATANLAEDGDPITISFAISDNANVNLPGITTVQYYVDQTKWKYHNSNKSLENNTHDIDQGVVYWGEPLHRGEEIYFSIPGNSTHVGVWNGGTGVTGSNNVRNKSNWETKWQYNHNRTEWESSSSSTGPTGVEFPKDIQVDNGSYSVKWDYNSNKLQLWEISTAHDWLLSSANSQVSAATTQYLYFSRGGDNTGGESLPSVTHRQSEWTLESHVNPVSGKTVHSGVVDDEMWKSTRSLKAGMKIKTTLGSDIKLHHWGVGYGGTTGMGNGPVNPYGNATGSWRSSNSQELRAEQNSTFNNNYTAAVDTSQNLTLGLEGRNISWRYNSDNSWDLFDEDTDEVIITGDNSLSGEMYPHLFGAAGASNYQTNICQWEWEWNKAAWFMEYRDWDSSDNANTWLNLTPNGQALMEATTSLPFSNGHYSIGMAVYNVTWGEKMRPGQEFVWAQLNTNQNGSTKHNMIIGVLDDTQRIYKCGVKFYRGGYLKDVQQQDAGFTVVGAGSTLLPTAGTSMRLQYEYGTNKLVCYSLNAGVRTKLAESTAALDGNPIFISMGGDSTRLPVTSGVEVYGWETAHQPVGYYNPWNNWRIGGFPENVVGLTTGTHSSVLDYKVDQVLRHKDGLAPGYKMHWVTPASQINSKVGQWKTSNSISGLTNVENTDSYWDWSWETSTFERIDAVQGWSFNTSNSNYSATYWQDPNPGSTRISMRYHTDNTMDLYDESNNEVIITKTATNDGNPIYLSWVSGGNTNGVIQMNDDFFGGGDVGIALTSISV